MINGEKCFEWEDMKKLELVLLGPGVDPHYTTCSEDIADIHSTFNFAYFDGDAPICYDGYPEQEMLVEWVRKLCEHLKVHYSIYTKDSEVLLDLHPELRSIPIVNV